MGWVGGNKTGVSAKHYRADELYIFKESFVGLSPPFTKCREAFPLKTYLFPILRPLVRSASGSLQIRGGRSYCFTYWFSLSFFSRIWALSCKMCVAY